MSHPSATFAAPAGPAAIAAAEDALGVTLPADLAGLQLQTDGVRDEYGFALVWSVAETAARNCEMRATPAFAELYMPFDCLLLFGEAGNGDLFGYAIRARAVRSDDIYVWDHETDGRVWVAGGLRQFVEVGRQGWVSR